MPPRKQNDFPTYMTPDGDRGGFFVRNPLNGKKKRFTDADAARKAAEALAKYVDLERQARALDDGRPTVASLVDAWKRDKLQFQPWDSGTKRNNLLKMERVRRDIGHRLLNRTDCLFLEEWLAAFCHTADTFNKWRYALVLLWKYGVSRKLVDGNEAEKVEFRSTSKKLDANKKKRRQMDVRGFKAIHAKAPAWLQLAMEQSLVTLQARNEICNMRHPDYRDGFLFVIRDKVSGDSDMAFIKIAMTDQLDDIRRRSLTLDDTVSPYLVHRKPDHRRRQWIEGKPHWTYVIPDYLTKAFAEARDKAGVYEHLKPGERPTFHEIRGLGSRLYLAQGVPEEAIQALMTHASQRTTQIYLERGKAALTDADYHPVKAALTLSEMLK